MNKPTKGHSIMMLIRKVGYLKLENSEIQAENAKLKDQLADYEETLRYVKNNKSGHGFRINSVFSKWSDD